MSIETTQVKGSALKVSNIIKVGGSHYYTVSSAPQAATDKQQDITGLAVLLPNLSKSLQKSFKLYAEGTYHLITNIENPDQLKSLVGKRPSAGMIRGTMVTGDVIVNSDTAASAQEASKTELAGKEEGSSATAETKELSGVEKLQAAKAAKAAEEAK